VHPYTIHAEVIAGALADAGLEVSDVDGFATAATFPMEHGWEISVAEVAEYVGLQPSWIDSTDLGGAAYISHLGHAVAAIEAGMCDTAVVSYASAGRSSSLFGTRYDGGDYNIGPSGPGQWEIPYGPSTVATYALAATRYQHEFGVRPEQLAGIAVQCRANAHLNPDARYRDLITVDDVMESPMIASPLHKLDCCVVSDSGGAIVVTSMERAHDLVDKPVAVLGFGEAIGQVQMSQMKDFTETSAKYSGRRAFDSAGLAPSDIDVAQVYDSFTITVALTLESLGFVPPGEVGSFVESGGISPDGELPINTDGGGLSSNHPGRRGLLALIEGVRQLRGTSPGVQLADPKTCLVVGTGGSLSVTATAILGVD
jgi:acetyl-CoA acetyltransferase